jgi:cell division protein FtsW (lipid II flippase)
MIGARNGYTPRALFAGTEARSRFRIQWTTPAWLSVAGALLLSFVGIASISLTRPELATRQGAFLLIGIACALLVTFASPRTLRISCWLILAVALLLLVFVLLPFVPRSIVTPRNGARAWINLGAADFQPSELAKIAFILCLAQWLAMRGSPRSLRALVVPLALFAVPVALIVLEPDLGSALLFLPTLVAMLIAAGTKKRFVATALVAGAIAAPIGYFAVLKPYQRARIDAIVAQVKGDTRYERDIGFQGWRAMRLVGAGGVFGNDREHAQALVRFNALPEEHNDMVFAVVSCRFGLIGGLITLLASAAVAIGALGVAWVVRDGFSKLVAVGIGALLFAQMVVNIGMTIGLLPITGITLPFVSYGGSSLVACWTLVGLLVGIGVRPPTGGEKSAFDA